MKTPEKHAKVIPLPNRPPPLPASAPAHPPMKYARRHVDCSGRCPDTNKYKTVVKVSAFRFIESPITDWSFLPMAEQKRLNDEEAHKEALAEAQAHGMPAPVQDNLAASRNCGLWALSFNDTEQQALSAWNTLLKIYRNAATSRYGTHLGRVELAPTDGIRCKSNDKGHFDVHEFADAPTFLPRTMALRALPTKAEG